MFDLSRPFILASASPRRRQLLADAGYAFEVHPADVDETPPAHIAPADLPAYLATLKAQALASRFPNRLILAADTVVVLHGELLNKPVDEADAHRMLTALQGQAHTVFTGVCLLDAATGQTRTFTEASTVFMRPATPEAIAYYIQHHRPLDKAGAYGVQDWWGLRYVHRIEGCFYNVMGLPVPRLSSITGNL